MKLVVASFLSLSSSSSSSSSELPWIRAFLTRTCEGEVHELVLLLCLTIWI